LLAINVNDNALIRIERGVLWFIASKLCSYGYALSLLTLPLDAAYSAPERCKKAAV
jgi:hypothetical protein